MSKFGWSYPPGAANDPLAPYNQDFNDEICAYCGMDLPDDVTGFSEADEDAVNDGFCNAKCLKDWNDNGEYPSEDYGKPHLSPEQEQRRKDCHNLICEYNRTQANKKYADRCAPITVLDDIDFPEDDFCWDDQEAGDPHVYCCGEKDCPVQWHLIYFITEFKRENGKLEITIMDGDESGNWDIDSSWQEGDNWENSGVGYHFGDAIMDEYFISWAEYWLDAAITGEDPCEQTMPHQTEPDWIDFCLKAAEDNLKYLRNSPKKEHS